MSDLRAQVEAALQEVVDPALEMDLVSAECVKEIAVDGDRVRIDVQLGYPADTVRKELAEQLRTAAEGVPGVAAAEVTLQSVVEPHTVQPGVKLLDEVKNIIAVASGKGGVGKSTTAVNLALALAAEGARVGMLDADIYGPSQPRMLGISARPESRDGKKLDPVVNYGIQAMSSGFLIDEETPMVWRGPMVTQALDQLIRDTRWEGLDYLIVDMPPGTGDVQLTLAQRVPVSGAVIITTPQDIALLDARKGLKMFEKVNVPVLGVVENMSIHICSQCGHAEHIFGEGGGQRMADQYGVDLLGSLPLDISIREQADSGRPSVISEPDGKVAESYRQIARRVAGKLSLQKTHSGGAFPHISVSDT
ncbi:iron-sulfur cluster carrier protein ApbC [Alkalilimnicola ehrlichii MLHE-1]|uniref:Iron-sulfur cluster carrier protein n=1 Tax=Alkalilimnicola ehrlichii (strain ATCC BAA-1101 / DSM 17681 / MLHE-1) TaxID=187272 RepID=Q0A8D3_ALKEH|nr:iron-sulfur cluster carrier protein ApbC [Alkalilimnicola ehrlichii]ABI56904.1 protein of unknown function DUF59 [Alkalilimnicola ehrlichii MLHE-1]